MYRPQVSITIGSLNFKFVTDLKCFSSWQKSTDTAKITIPTKFQINGQTIIAGNNNVFHRGDPVKIEAGYYPNNETIFTGFVSRIVPKLPLIIECEDQTWILKQTNVTFSLKSTTLKNMLQTAINTAIDKTQNDLIAATLQNIKLNCIDCNLGSFRVTRCSIGQILDELKKVYGLVCYFRDNTLYAGLAYAGEGSEHDIVFEADVIDDKLDYIRKDDVRIRVHGISIQPNNKKIEADGGDPDGDQRTLLKYNVSKGDLQAMCNREADKFRYEGWRGSFKTFLTELIKHGDVINLTSKKLPELNGKYYVSACEVEGGVTGYFQTVSLGAKVSAGVNSF